MTPSFEVGARLDGGDAEQGFGADLGGGLAVANRASGLSLDLKARGLLAHEAAGFQDWGVSAALAYDLLPASDQGLSLALRQSWGATASGGMDALLDREALAGLRHTTAAAEHLPAAGRLEGEAGYGIALFGGAFTGTPNLGFGLSDGGARDYRVGWRLTPVLPEAPGYEVSLNVTRSESADGGAPPEHGALLRATLRW